MNPTQEQIEQVLEWIVDGKVKLTVSSTYILFKYSVGSKRVDSMIQIKDIKK